MDNGNRTVGVGTFVLIDHFIGGAHVDIVPRPVGQNNDMARHARIHPAIIVIRKLQPGLKSQPEVGVGGFGDLAETASAVRAGGIIDPAVDLRDIVGGVER